MENTFGKLILGESATFPDGDGFSFRNCVTFSQNVTVSNSCQQITFSPVLGSIMEIKG